MTMKNPLRDCAARILPVSLFSCTKLSVPEYRIDLSGSSGSDSGANSGGSSGSDSGANSGGSLGGNSGSDSGGGTEIRIVQVSDLHSNDYGGKDGILAGRIREAQPDLIVMTGDIFD
ncbi:MAG: hypothetical protein J6Y13_09820 [Treponema sp.]|nr:hypothetical protein [Treponema sp.]